MIETITLHAILLWLVWGFFMGIGWTTGSWLVSRLLTALG
jgi:hypothetical protein